MVIVKVTKKKFFPLDIKDKTENGKTLNKK